MVAASLLLLAPALTWALPSRVVTNKALLPRDDPPKPPVNPAQAGDDGLIPPAQDWDEWVKNWEGKANPPKALAHYMRYAQSFYREITEYPTLEGYKKPNEYVREIVSPGDSFTAGIGSNGKGDHFADSGWFADGECGRYSKAWPEQLRDNSGWKDLQKEGYRRNNFGACSGHTISNIETQQLLLGENKNGDKFKAIGKPQIAVLTAGGNDFKFGDVVINCILGVLGTSKCESTLKEIEAMLEKRDDQIYHYQELFSHIILGGRLAKGADPPEAFQVYIGTYIPFFNEDDEVCNSISWNMWGSNIKLDKDFRRRLNVMVERVNDIIRDAADSMKDWGVYYVDGYQKAFDGHRFCDPVPDFEDKTDLYVKQYHSEVFQDYGAQTYFWSWRSKWDPPVGPNGQGDEHPITYFPEKSANVSKVLEILIPDEEQRNKVQGGEDPAQFNAEAFKDMNSFQGALKNAASTADEETQGIVGLFTNDGFFRIWHPKEAAHKFMADSFFDVIKNSRAWDFVDPEPAPPPSSSKLEFEDHCADTTKYSKFDYARAEADIKDFCKGGMDLITPAAPLYNTYDHSQDDINMKLHLGIQWSDAGQDGCNPYQNSDHIDEGACYDKFMAAMNRCNTETITEKYGQYPMTWNSPGGCVDLWLVGHGPDWSCADQGQKTPECEGKPRF